MFVINECLNICLFIYSLTLFDVNKIQIVMQLLLKIDPTATQQIYNSQIKT